MSEYLILFLEVLPTPNHMRFINGNANKVTLELVFLFLIVYYQNQDWGTSNAYGEANMILYICLSIRRHLIVSLETTFEINAITDSPV